MGGDVITPLVQSKLVKTEIQASFPYLIEIWKESDSENKEVFRYVNASEDKTFEGNVFSASYFKMSPPERTDSGIKDAKITISSVDQVWIKKIRETSGRFKIRFVASIVYENDGSEYVEALDDITFVLTNASWNESTIDWTMKFDEWQDINVPCQSLTQFVCPALF